MGYAEREGLRPQGNVPNLRFPEFSGEWEKKTIGDFGDIITGNTPSTKEEQFYVDGKHLWVSPSDLGYCKFIHDTQTKLTDLGFAKTRKLPKGSILVTCIGSTIGKMGMASRELSTNQQINSVVVSEKYDNDFIYYAIQSRFPRYLSSIAVQAVPILSKSSFSALPNDCPSFDEQSKIGRLLRLIDERIDTQNKIIEDLKSLIKGLNDSLHENMNGELVAFSDLGEVYSGLAGKSASDFGSGKPYITYLNVYQNTMIDCSQYDYVSVNTNERQNKVHYGDLLFTLSSETADEVGIGSVYLGNEDELYLNSFCFGIHINATDKVYSPYLAFLVSCRQFRRFVYPLAQGSTRFNLQKGDFMKRNFMLPPYAKQVQIADTLNCLATKIANENKLLASYHIQKEHLLRTMFI